MKDEKKHCHETEGENNSEPYCREKWT